MSLFLTTAHVNLFMLSHLSKPLYVYVDIYVYVYIYRFIYTCMHAYIQREYVCVYIYIYICVYIHTHTHIYTYIHTHTHSGLVTKSDSQNPMDWSQQGSSVPRIFQARLLEWVAFPSPGDLLDSGVKPGSPALQTDSLPTELPGKHMHMCIHTHTHTYT